MKNALIIIDMQYDFCDGGPLAHYNSLEIIPIINRIRDQYDFTIFVGDKHPPNHSSFTSYGGLYPPHCIENTNGSKIHSDLIIRQNDLMIFKGTLQKYDSMSAFYDAEGISKYTKLKNFLNTNNIDNLFFCGNSMENTIFSTIIDAINLKLKCSIIQNAISYYDKKNTDKCTNYLLSLNVKFITV